MQFQAENLGNVTQGNFMGTVKNENNQFLEGVQISIGNTITTTDRNGIFIMNNVDVYENFAYIRAQKTGYLNGSRTLIPKEDGVNRVEIRLYKKEPIATINSGEVSQVDVDLFHSITFRGGFIDSNGNPYTGQVDVVANYFPPNLLNSFDRMPGSLFGQSASNEAVGLETYGMMQVELFSPSGEELNIDENSPALLQMKISSSQTDIAPETMNLWYFDEEVGYWKEEGEATKQGDRYEAEVTHFSWWNCDVPFDGIQFCFDLKPSNADGISQYYFFIRRASNDQLIYGGLTTSGEVECGLIPRNEAINVSVYASAIDCANTLIYETSLGGYSTDTSTTISFEDPNQITEITGTITNCQGNPLSSGYLYINGNSLQSITNGMINYSVQHCSNIDVDLQIYDFETNQWKIIEDVTLNGDVVDISSQSTCDDTGGVYNGNIILRTQQEINEFGQFEYARINGNLTIEGNDSINSEITDLSPLSTINKVDSNLNIRENPLLESLDGLENLRSADWLVISNNDNLSSLSGIAELISIDTFWLVNNSSLNSLSTLTDATINIGWLKIDGNPNLTSLNGLQNSTINRTLTLEDNPLLSNLSGLKVDDDFGWMEILNNDGLTDLTGLTGVHKINYLFVAGNDSLESLNGLENLNENLGIFIGLYVQTDIIAPLGNDSLRDLCALQNLFSSGTFASAPSGIFGGTFIENNLFNPSYTEIGNGDCSL